MYRRQTCSFTGPKPARVRVTAHYQGRYEPRTVQQTFPADYPGGRAAMRAAVTATARRKGATGDLVFKERDVPPDITCSVACSWG